MILGLNPYPVSIHSFILSQQHTQKQSWYEGLLMQELVGLVFFLGGGGSTLVGQQVSRNVQDYDALLPCDQSAVGNLLSCSVYLHDKEKWHSVLRSIILLWA